jgi:hypothetical protein
MTPGLSGPVRFTVDPWDPGYGIAFSEDPDDTALAESSAELNLDVEFPAGQWHPIAAPAGISVPGTVLFLDGVRRIEAWVWVHGGDSDGVQPSPGIAASVAVGLVTCNGTAKVDAVSVERGLFTAAPEVTDLVTRAVSYPARMASGPGADQLSLALQRRLSAAEVRLALSYRDQYSISGDLLVVDGPLRGRTHLDRTVGYIKTHHASYLPGEQAGIVASLRPGERTPAFTIGTSWRRSTWYLRLPGAYGVPWSGVVRLECSADLPPAEVIRLADITAAVLPPMASTPHKDPRAPQNLVPIGGLERRLRHMLGDQEILYRSLRVAAAECAV